MNKKSTTIILSIIAAVFLFSFNQGNDPARYERFYTEKINGFNDVQLGLLATIKNSDLSKPEDVENIHASILKARTELKSIDFWLRYLDPVIYRRINGPLPVEWETEVFEKFEAPYKREGTGLTQAALYLDEENPEKEHLLYLVQSSIDSRATYLHDSTTKHLKTDDHFFLCNRLYLLNLAAIYTTGFECPDTSRIIPELRSMMSATNVIYNAFNESFGETPLPTEYLALYNKAVDFVNGQPANYSQFDHFTFIRDYVNPLFIQNQKLLNKYKVFSRSMVDYSMNKKEISIFDKDIYYGQNAKGIFHRVEDEATLKEIENLGRMLFYDPILSANNMRSCASCHKPDEFFTDTLTATNLQFNQKDFLPRNTPSLINASYNHLLMIDGKHISLTAQTKDVMTNPNEMGSKREEILEKVLSCNEYKQGFKKLLQYTPTEKEITIDHIASSITLYYSKFSRYYSPFDEAMNEHKPITAASKEGFNLFMSKAQCATCHFVPQFNGVKPPFVSSEFEVLGVPLDTNFTALSKDMGRHDAHQAEEMKNAFRTGSLRNIAYTKPYMHNGVFNTLEQLVDFYNAGGGAGRGLNVPNQTLSADSLGLSAREKGNLVKFMASLNENVVFEAAPQKLPQSKNKSLNSRKVGGVY